MRLKALTTDFTELTKVDQNKKLVARIGVIPKSFSSNEEPVTIDLTAYKMENNYRVDEGIVLDFDCIDFIFPTEELGDCGMTITKIDPLTVAAGVGEMSENGVSGVITITGTNFLNEDQTIGNCGILPKDHKVLFTTVSGEWISPFETDYLKYTATEIKVKVPTAGYKEDGSTIVYAHNDLCAATGPIRIYRKKSNGTKCTLDSKDNLIVKFTATNGYKQDFSNGGCYYSSKMILRDMNLLGAYTIFYSGGSDSLTTVMKEKYLAALNIWRCETLVPIFIDNLNPYTNEDGNCLVYQKPINDVILPNGQIATTTASTSPSWAQCNSQQNYYYLRKFDMYFNKNLDWSGNTFNLTSTALHELGHVFQLLHTKNGGSHLMDRPSSQTFSNIDSYTKQGANHLVLLSASITGEDCNPDEPDLMLAEDCILSDVIDINGNDIKIILYPNPSSEFVTIEFSENTLIDQQGVIELIDIRGKKIKSNKINNLSKYNIDIKELEKGIYIVNLYFNNQNLQIGKFVKI